MIIAPVLSWFAWRIAGDAVHIPLPWLAAGSWLAGIGLVIAGSWQAAARPAVVSRLRFEGWLLAALFLAAFLLRFIQLGQIPWLLSGDEGSVGLWAVKYIYGEVNNLFIDGWFSFPAFYYFFESLPIHLFGQTAFAIRLPSAFAGATTVIILYIYVRDTFGRGAALASAAYLATFPFHIHFSRLALQNVWDGLSWVAFSLMFFRAWSSNRQMDFTLAGIVLGFAPFFYVSTRTLFLIIPLWLALAFLKDRPAFYQRVPGMLSMLLATVVVLLPLALFLAYHPADFTAPLSRVSLWKDWPGGGSPWASGAFWIRLVGNFRDSTLAFTSTALRGSFYAPGKPMLLPLPAILFLFGFLLTLRNLTNLKFTWLLFWLLAVIIPGALSESAPAAQRYILAAPAVSILVAMAIVKGIEKLSAVWPNKHWQIATMLGAVLILAMMNDLVFYFKDYSGGQLFGDANTEVANAAAYFLIERSPGKEVYFAGPPGMGYFSHSTIPYLVPQDTGHDIVDPITAPPDWSLSGPSMFIFLPERIHELAFIQDGFPGGEIFQRFGRGGSLLFTAYEVSHLP